MVFAKSYGLETVSLRYFNVFGPRQDPESLYSAVIPKFMEAAFLGRPLEVHWDGRQSRDFTHISNVVQANLLAAKAVRGIGETFNIANGKTYSLLDIVSAIEGILGGGEIKRFPKRAGDVRKTNADISGPSACWAIAGDGLQEGHSRHLRVLRKSISAPGGWARNEDSVTGAWALGSNFIRHYLSRNRADTIVNLDLCTYAGNPANLEGMAGARRHRWVRGDITDPKAVDRCMKGAEAVVHFAAESHVDRSILEPGAFLKTNILGTQVLLDAALRHKARRFLHVSTDEVYGSVETGRSREGDALEPNSPYAASKASSDLLVRSYGVTFGLDAVITRASNNFGPYQFPEKALPLMIANWLSGLPFPLYGDGRNVRDWVFVGDHVRGIELALRKGKAGEVYNIGGTRSLANRDLVAMVRRLMGVGPELVQPVPDRPGHDRRYALDCSRLKALGFRHAWTFEKALESTVRWYRDNSRWWKPLKGRKDYKSYYKTQYKKG